MADPDRPGRLRRRPMVRVTQLRRPPKRTARESVKVPLETTQGNRLHPYESLVRGPFPYWVAFPALGLVILAGGETVVGWLGDRDFRVTQAIFAMGLGLGPALLIYLAHDFVSTLGGVGTDSLSSVLWPSGADGDATGHQEAFDRWLERWRRHIFGLKSRRAKSIVVLVEIAGLLTLFWSGLEYRTLFLNAACVVLFAMLLWLAGQAAFTFAQLLRLLSDIGSREVYVPFYRLPHPAISSLLRYYSWLALATVAGYVLLATAIWAGPYGLSPVMLIWLTVLAAYPVAMTTWSITNVHAMLRRAKQHHLDSVNQLVLKSLDVAERGGSVSDLEALRKAIALQESTRHLSEWPFSWSAGVALVASLGAAGAQAAALWVALARH
jgi:hypothetical protein